MLDHTDLAKTYAFLLSTVIFFFFFFGRLHVTPAEEPLKASCRGNCSLSYTLLLFSEQKKRITVAPPCFKDGPRLAAVTAGHGYFLEIFSWHIVTVTVFIPQLSPPACLVHLNAVFI